MKHVKTYLKALKRKCCNITGLQLPPPLHTKIHTLTLGCPDRKKCSVIALKNFKIFEVVSVIFTIRDSRAFLQTKFRLFLSNVVHKFHNLVLFKKKIILNFRYTTKFGPPDDFFVSSQYNCLMRKLKK